MSISKTVKQYLDRKRIAYSVLELERSDSLLDAARHAGINARHLYYPVVLRDPFGLMMAVLPASHRLDLEMVSRALSRKVDLALQTQLTTVFADCSPGHIPPLGEAYGLRTVIDSSLSTPEEVYIVAGDQGRLIKLSRKDFMLLQSNAWLCSDFAVPIVNEDTTGQPQEANRNFYIRQRVEQATGLPPMPDMARRLLTLQADPAADVADLVKVVEQDPSLAAQTLRFANSAYFGYQGRVSDLKVAVARVLGYDMAINMMIGVALARPFRIPRSGPLGLEACWRQAVYTAVLMQGLVRIMPKELRPRRGMTYVAGLLHNFGYLVLGHLFRREYQGLVEAVNASPETPVRDLERAVLGMDHGELGALLLKAWSLPEEVVTACGEYLNAEYSGSHEIYPRLVRVAGHLLKAYDIGNAETAELLEEDLRVLGLVEVDLVTIAEDVLSDAEGLDELARRLAA